MLTDFIVNGGKVVTAVAQKRDELTSLVSNANTALGAIAGQNASLDRALQVLPPTLRQANTTFVNLRAALDDLDPLVNTAKKATKNLNPFLLKLRPVVNRAVPVLTDLRRTVKAPDGSNPLADLVRASVPLHQRGGPASQTGVAALNASQPVIAFARPYAPDLLGSFSKLGQVAGYYDAERPLRPRPERRLQPLQLELGHQQPRPDPARGQVQWVHHGDLDPLSGRRHAADHRLEPVHRPGQADRQVQPG